MHKVSYTHLKGYRVSRTFDTREAAQEFIDVNALICPLPGVRLEEIAKPARPAGADNPLDGPFMTSRQLTDYSDDPGYTILP